MSGARRETESYISTTTTYAEHLKKGNSFNHDYLAKVTAHPRRTIGAHAGAEFKKQTVFINTVRRTIERNEQIEKNIRIRKYNIAVGKVKL